MVKRRGANAASSKKVQLKVNRALARGKPLPKKGKGNQKTVVERIEENLTPRQIEKLGERKATTRKGKRILEEREGQVTETSRKVFFLKGNKTNDDVNHLLGDLNDVCKPESIFFGRKKQKELRPFEDISRLEFLMEKNNTAVFCVGSSNKKRPMALTFGRMFGRVLLDMIEFVITDYIPAMAFPKARAPRLGSKPIVICQGPAFMESSEMDTARSMLTCAFTGAPATKLFLPDGVERCVVFTAMDNKTISFKHYRLRYKNSSLKAPQVALEEAGPSFTMAISRSHLADTTMMKQAMYVPKYQTLAKTKNIEKDNFGSSLGRIHVGKVTQDLHKLYTPLAKLTSQKTEVASGLTKQEVGEECSTDESSAEE